jgi:hypothetical protein
MPQSIPAGLKREHVLLALADLDAGFNHPFGEPTKYELTHEGKRYAPKAVVGLAFRYLTGRALSPNEFSGGKAPGQANYVLRQLGFTVVQKGEWSPDEATSLVADYFDMLRLEMLGEAYSKAAHHKALLTRLSPGRTEASVELMHANVSAALVGLGLPYIDGYKPRGNYQHLLADAAEAFLDQAPDYLRQLADAPTVNPDKAPAPPQGPDGVVGPPPEEVLLPPPGKPWLSRRGRRIDFAELDAANRRLGQFGEKFVVDLERRRLEQKGRDDLAKRVVWASREWGDGLGFDVLSFGEADGGEHLLEVKTTGLGKYHPFRVTATEVRCSEDVPDKFRLFRLFDFGRSPRAYILHGSLRQTCRLGPASYLAAI